MPFEAAKPAKVKRLGASDQAEGLRRLLVRNQIQVITLVAGKQGVGRTSLSLNLAASLVAAGKDVLVLDENPAPHNLTDSLGLFARYDLLDVAQGRCQLRDAALAHGGYAILPVARLMRMLTRLSKIEQECMVSALMEVSAGVDVVLVDGGMLDANTLVSASLASGVRVVVVMDATASGITESYSLIKRLALEHARLRFEIVVNKVPNEQVARLVFGNMEQVARAHLDAKLEYLGCIPLDERQKRATQLARSLIDAYPAAVSAKACQILSQSVLHKTMPQDEMPGGIGQMMENLIKQIVRQQEMTPAVMQN